MSFRVYTVVQYSKILKLSLLLFKKLQKALFKTRKDREAAKIAAHSDKPLLLPPFVVGQALRNQRYRSACAVIVHRQSV
jgi:hypothetical protein